MMHQVRNIIILAQVLIGLSLTSEAQLKDTTHFFQLYEYNEEIKFLGVLDDKLVVLKKFFTKKETTSSGYSHILLIDSVELFISGNDLFLKDVIINDSPLLLLIEKPSLQGRENTYLTLNLHDGRLKRLELADYVLAYHEGGLITGPLTLSKYDGYGDYITEIRYFSINENSFSPVAAFPNDPQKAEGVVKVLPYSQINKLIVKLAYCYTPLSGCEDNKTYLIDLKDNIISERNESIFRKEIAFSYRELSGNYYLIKSGREMFLYSADGAAEPVIKRKFDLKGWNYENDSINSYNFVSHLDQPKYKGGKTLTKVIIPYKLSYPLEILMYKVYHGREVEKQTVQKLGLYELLILKNMVFAKHNYAFDKPFYQAFFNLFDFYNSDEMRKARTKEVSPLLSEVDKKNLKLIMNALKKFED